MLRSKNRQNDALKSSEEQIIELESGSHNDNRKSRRSARILRWLRIVSVGTMISLLMLMCTDIGTYAMIEIGYYRESFNGNTSIKREANDQKTTSEQVQITMKSAVGFPHELSGEEIMKRRTRLRISLVISHCDVALDWVPNYIGDRYHVQDITVYSKCGKQVKGLDKLKSEEKPRVIRLPNVGRCDHSYAYWIKEHYESIDKDRDGDNIVLFMKDNNYHQNTYRRFNEIFSLTSELGFGCALKPIWCDCPEGFHQCSPNDGLMLHNQTEVNAFEMRHRHIRLDRDGGEVDTFVSDKYPTLKSWKDSMGLVTAKSEAIPVCYGGVFAAKKGRLLNQSQKAWENVEESLTREDNLVEGHYAERLWAAVLGNLDDNFVNALDEVVVPVINETSKCMGRPGMILISKAATLNFL